MKTSGRYNLGVEGKRAFLGVLLLIWGLVGCAAVNPKPEQLQLPPEQPVATTTVFSDALTRLGIQSQVYGVELMKIQCREVDDDTGVSYHSGGEIPKNITLMVNSALNAIGGRVVYIPYWPDYFAGIQVSGYPAQDQKLVPDVVLAGGITEFDRVLVAVDRSRNLDIETKEISGAPDAFDGQTIGMDFSQADKWNEARIGVDFNLVSFKAQFGIPKMQATNGVTVYKGVKEGELGFTLFGPTIGLRGSVKKIQGRHAAVRSLVQFSVIQLVGRYLDLPYWTLLDGAAPDPVVMENLRTGYLGKDRAGRILSLKRLLWLHGHPVAINDQLDPETRSVLAKLDASYDGKADTVPVDTFVRLYLSVPVNAKSLTSGNRFDRAVAQRLAALQQQQLKEKPTPSKPKKPAVKKNDRPKEKKRSEATKPKTKKPVQQAPKPEVIIVTPLDTQTSYTLQRLVRRIEDKRQNRGAAQHITYPPTFNKPRANTAGAQSVGTITGVSVPKAPR
ncbi:MAG: hypothetical protein P8010_25305 [Desulfosarcinaceae bacterium]